MCRWWQSIHVAWSWVVGCGIAWAVVLGPVSHVTAQEVPYVGIVVQLGVQIRSGAGETFYIVGKADQGMLVTVDEVIYGWYKIAAPPGTFSYISTKHIQPDADNVSGTVQAARTAVKAASLDGPGDSYRRQIYLLKGEAVQLVGEEGGFYKIIPPKGAYVYLPPGAVRRATDAEISAPEDPRQSTEEISVEASLAGQLDRESDEKESEPISQVDDPVTETVDPQSTPNSDAPVVDVTPINDPPKQAEAAPTVVNDVAAEATDDADWQSIPDSRSSQPIDEKPVADPVSTQSMDEKEKARGQSSSGQETAKTVKLQPVTPAVQAVEQRMLEASALPLEEQPIQSLWDQYEVLRRDQTLPLTDQRIISRRIAQLRRNQEVVAALKQINTVRQSTAPEADADKVPSSGLSLPGQPRPRYVVSGILLGSAVYNGVDLPRLFRVVEPGQPRTIGYVRPSTVFNASAMLGKHVGVVGKKVIDPGTKLEVIDAQRVDVLRTDEAQ